MLCAHVEVRTITCAYRPHSTAVADLNSDITLQGPDSNSSGQQRENCPGRVALRGYGRNYDGNKLTLYHSDIKCVHSKISRVSFNLHLVSTSVLRIEAKCNSAATECYKIIHISFSIHGLFIG